MRENEQQLPDPHIAETFGPTKESNPKDAIGDRKVPLWLCSPIARAQWALAQFAGLIKYGAWNWRKAGVRSSVYIAALNRHIDAYTSGEEYDPVDNTHHLGNIMACAAILLDAKAAGKLTDDRPPSVGIRETYAQVETQMAALREQYKDYQPGGPKAPRHYTIADTERAAAGRIGLWIDDSVRVSTATIGPRIKPPPFRITGCGIYRLRNVLEVSIIDRQYGAPLAWLGRDAAGKRYKWPDSGKWGVGEDAPPHPFDIIEGPLG
jgi:hypothetical protein